ncbi:MULTISPECIES: hypothetical protein [Thalassotalea]|uniref:hypothetical protein n=1 Tax=Thalassotalea TaxID=1518149 RepID=UPI0009423F35|nr:MULTISPECIES: hypothetical protein [Thalassotalea]OKY25296.1 hypothetical protein BI291_16885 [Thalassotalea sp. PP2-459]
MSYKSLFITCLFCITFSSFSALADRLTGVLEGTYLAVSGHSTSREVSRLTMGESPRQVGKYKLVLKREGWKDLSKEDKKRIRKRLVIKGEFTGVMDMSTHTLNHTLVNQDKSGTLYSHGDYLIPEQGDAYCSNGVPLAGIEHINFVNGSGIYQHLIVGKLQLKAQVNNCPTEENFLQNEFTVIVGNGSLTFAATGE